MPYTGPASTAIHQLIGGLRAAMGYTGSASIGEMRNNARFLKISNAGLRKTTSTM